MGEKDWRKEEAGIFEELKTSMAAAQTVSGTDTWYRNEHLFKPPGHSNKANNGTESYRYGVQIALRFSLSHN